MIAILSSDVLLAFPLLLLIQKSSLPPEPPLYRSKTLPLLHKAFTKTNLSYPLHPTQQFVNMFSTWRFDEKKSEIQTIRQTTDPILARTHGHVACDRCHEKKVSYSYLSISFRRRPNR